MTREIQIHECLRRKSVGEEWKEEEEEEEEEEAEAEEEAERG